MLLIDRFKANPLDALLFLIMSMVGDLLDTTFGALGRLVMAPLEFQPGGNVLLLFLIVLVVGIGVCFLLVRRSNSEQEPVRKQWAWQALTFGVLSMLTAGWPFWITELPVEPLYFNSRFTMPFILGASVFLIGLLELLPWRKMRAAILALVLGASMGVHLLIANDFRLDWVANKKLIQQVYTRIPMLEPGTTILFDKFEMPYTSTATFTAQLNLLYPPQPGMRTVYGALVAHQVDGWEQPKVDTPIRVYLIFEVFWGRMDKSILAYFPHDEPTLMPPPNCAWLMDQEMFPLSQQYD
ncbi:MAG TPA: hypothetical protein VFF78_08705, partial [Anaerolineaceae bacterium]|nr:hypothetical protein [Anaerolineaceae bacterium]